MIYIEISGEKFPCTIHPFHTQKGKDAIRVISEAPVANGFRILDDNDNVIFDGSEFTNLYRTEGDTIKEYTAEAEEIIPTESSFMGDIPASSVQRQISSLNRRVTEITPYTESKTAYIDDEDVFFDIPKDGNISVFMVDGDGQNVPFTFEQINGQIKVSFKKRESLATVTISIQ